MLITVVVMYTHRTCVRIFMYIIIIALTVLRPVKSLTAAGDVNGDHPTKGENKKLLEIHCSFFFFHASSFTARVVNANSFYPSSII